MEFVLFLVTMERLRAEIRIFNQILSKCFVKYASWYSESCYRETGRFGWKVIRKGRPKYTEEPDIYFNFFIYIIFLGSIDKNPSKWGREAWE